ncbi:PAS domain S-box protein [Candidatus Peregrinibacteria bacterium]|nr:PAS domain S-box protein [Candidatus Peregrinibacteria bacterium]
MPKKKEVGKKTYLKNEEIPIDFQSIYECAGDAIYIIKVPKKGLPYFVDCNSYTLKLFGWDNKSKIIGKSPVDFAPPIQPDGMTAKERILIEAKKVTHGKPLHSEWKFLRSDGTYVNTTLSLSSLNIKRGKYILVIARDITLQKRAEKDLTVQKEWSEKLVDLAPNIVIGLGKTSKILVFNKFAEELTGYKAKEVIGKKWIDLFIPKEQQNELYKVLSDVFKNQYIHHIFENPIITKSGEKKLFSWHNTFLKANGSEAMVFSIGEDITERKKNEEQIFKDLSLINATLESTADAILVVDQNGKWVTYNTIFLQMWDIPAVIAESKDDDRALKYVLNKIKNPKAFITSVKFLYANPVVESFDIIEFKDGRIFERFSKPQYLGDEIVGRVWSFRDVTEKKRIEDQLISNSKFPSENPNPVMRISRKGILLYANGAAFKLCGKQKIGQKIKSKCFQEALKLVLSTDKNIIKEISINNQFYIFTISPVKGTDYVNLYGRNITERKISENKLKEREKELREAQAMAHIGNWLWNIKTGEVEWSDEVYKIFRRNPKTFKPKIDTIMKLSNPWPEDRNRHNELIRKAIKSKTAGSYEQKFLLPDGTTGHYYSTFKGIYDEKSNLIYIKGTVQDITERMNSEIALKESEEKFRSLFLNMHNGFALHEIVLNKKGKPIDYVFLDVNEGFEKITGLNRNKIVGKNVTKVLKGIENDPVDWIGKYGKVAITRRPIKFESYSKDLDKWFMISAYSPKKNQFATLFDDITFRKKSEDVMMQAEAEYKQLVETSLDGFSVKSIDGKFLECNSAFEKMVGYSIKELRSMNYKKLTPERWHKWESDIIENKVKKDGKSGLYEKEYIRKDGSVFPVELNSYLIKDETGEPIKIIAFSRDITERVEYEKAIRDAESKYRDIVENSPEMIHSIDENGYIVFANNKEYELLGYDLGELIGLHMSKLYSPELMEFVKKGFKELTEEGSLFIPSTQMIKKNGELIDVEIHSIAIFDKTQKGNGKFIRTRSIARDITKEKKAQIEISKMQLGFERSEEIMFMTDSEGKINYINPAFEKVYGYKKHEVIGKTPNILKSGKQNKEFYENFWNNLLNKKSMNVELINKTKAGDLINIKASANPIISDEGNIVGFLAIQSDITEQKKAEEELNKKVEQMEFIGRVNLKRHKKMLMAEKEIQKLKAEIDKLKNA